jgi:raffinose/stachyose/melibiose transport system permease protein
MAYVDRKAHQQVRARQRRAGWQRGENLVAYLMTLPALIPFVLFNLIPIFWVVFISFTEYDGFGSPIWAGLTNYRAVLADESWWQAVRTTGIFGLGKLLVEIPLALTLAVIVNQKIVGATWFRTIFFLPHVISISVMSIIFYFIFRPYQGILNGILQNLSLIEQPIDFLGRPTSALLAVIGVGIWSGFGVNMVLFLAGLQTIPQDVYESSALDGANAMQQLWYITIPLLGPVLRIIVLLAIVGTLRSFDLIKVLTDGGPFGSTEVMFTYIFRYFFGGDFGAQYGYGAALGVVAAMLIGLVSLAYARWARTPTN